MNVLAAQFRQFNRQLYASLPWGYRVAGLMLYLASSLTDSLGKVIYFELIKSGVTNMPDVNGAPAHEFVDKYPRNPERLPAGYGRKFADRIYATLLGKARNPNTVEEAISDYLVTLSRKGIPVPEGSTLAQAEGYVMRSVLNSLKDYLKGSRGPDMRGGPSLDEEEVAEHILTDPQAFKNLDDMLPQSELRRLMRELEHINPRAPSWLEAQLEGLSNVELAAEWGVGKSAISEWERTNLPKIKKMVLDHIREAA